MPEVSKSWTVWSTASDRRCMERDVSTISSQRWADGAPGVVLVWARSGDEASTVTKNSPANQGCVKLSGPRAVPARSAQKLANGLRKTAHLGAVGAAPSLPGLTGQP